MVTEENETVAAAAETLLFSVKPQILKPVCENLTGSRATFAAIDHVNRRWSKD